MSSENFYIKLRRRIRNWENSEKGKNQKYLEYILAIPDIFYVILKMELDPRIPVDTKLKLGGLIAYWIWPIDIIPDVIFGVFGYMDDLAISAMALNSLLNKHSEIVEEYWSQVSEKDLLISLKNIIDGVDALIGKGLWNKIKKAYNTKYKTAES